MVSKEEFIKDIKAVIHTIDIMESNETISLESWTVIDTKLHDILSIIYSDSLSFKDFGVEE